MNPIDGLKERARGSHARIVLPEPDDERIIAAAALAVDEDWAVPVFVGDPDKVRADCHERGLADNAYQVYDHRDPKLVQEFTAAYIQRRGKHLRPEVARRLVERPLIFGGMLVTSGRADGFVAGARNSSTSVVECARLAIGPAPGISTPSSFFVMVLPQFRGERNKTFYFADCAAVIDPDARQLADIAVATARSVKKMFGVTPRTALMSFSTRRSAKHRFVDKVAQATDLARQAAPEFEFDGELQMDAAVIPEIAERKRAMGSVAGHANVLVFPNLEAGNIGYKLVEQFAGASAYGPFMQGLAHPTSDLSRGSSFEDIAGTIAAVAAQCAD